MSKVIDIPKEELKDVPIRVVQGSVIVDQKITLPFTEFLQTSLDAYEPLGKGLKAGRQANKIAGKIEAINGDPTVVLEDEEYEIVKNAVEAMQWVPGANRRLGDYHDAVEKAQDVPTPTKK